MYRICEYSPKGIRLFVQCPCGTELEVARYNGAHSKINIVQDPESDGLCVVAVSPFVNPTFVFSVNEFRVYHKLKRYITDWTDGKFLIVIEDDAEKRIPSLLPEPR